MKSSKVRVAIGIPRASWQVDIYDSGWMADLHYKNMSKGPNLADTDWQYDG